MCKIICLIPLATLLAAPVCTEGRGKHLPELASPR